eukprot:685249-Prymnesium_polylepis.2
MPSTLRHHLQPPTLGHHRHLTLGPTTTPTLGLHHPPKPHLRSEAETGRGVDVAPQPDESRRVAPVLLLLDRE